MYAGLLLSNEMLHAFPALSCSCMQHSSLLGCRTPGKACAAFRGFVPAVGVLHTQFTMLTLPMHWHRSPYTVLLHMHRSAC